MNTVLYYEDVEVGTEITPLVKHPDIRQLVMWAGASGDYYPLHYDKDFAKSQGLSGLIVHGQLSFCFLGQLLTDWIGDEGVLRKVGCSFRGMVFPDEDLTCRGEVTKKYIKDGDHYVECNIWTENPKGERAIQGSATVNLPSQSN
jgi:acyl dehydratase